MATYTLLASSGNFFLLGGGSGMVSVSCASFAFTGVAALFAKRILFARPGAFVLTGKDGLATYFLHPEAVAFTLGTPAPSLLRTDWNPVVAQQPFSRAGGALYAIVARTIRGRTVRYIERLHDREIERIEP